MQYRSAAPRPCVPRTRQARASCPPGRGRWPPGTERKVGWVPVEGPGSPPCEVRSFGVEYLVRAARVTDIDRLVALGGAAIDGDRGASPLGAADLLRQLVYLPQASIFVAEAQRNVVGGAVLALRPSVVAGGYVGTIDLLVVDADHDADRVTAALLEELIRSASNKGCTVIEAVLPDGSGRRRSLGGPRVHRGRSAHPTKRGRGRQCRASHLTSVSPAVQRDRAGRATSMTR